MLVLISVLMSMSMSMCNTGNYVDGRCAISMVMSILMYEVYIGLEIDFYVNVYVDVGVHVVSPCRRAISMLMLTLMYMSVLSRCRC